MIEGGITMHCGKVTLKSGKISWYCMEDAPPDPITGKRRTVKRRGKTQREAKKRVEDAINELKKKDTSPIYNANITFNEVANHWLEVYKSSGIKDGTIRIRKKELKILNKYFVNVPIIKIDHYKYQVMLLKLAKDGNKGKPYARNTIKGAHTTAGLIFKFAIKNKILAEDPRDGVTIPKPVLTIEELENNKIEEGYFESDELNEFFDTTLVNGLELDLERFYLLAFTGMRPGELCALKKQDFNFENNTIRISKTLSNENGNTKQYRLDTTKTGKMRIIDVNESVMKMIKKVILKNDENKLRYKNMIDDYLDEDFVFQRYNGYPFFSANMRDRMHRILRLTKIKKNLTPHCFRHTHISMMAEAGVDLPTIMQRVGHDNPDTTLKVYTHVTNKMKSESIKKVTNLHSNLLEKTSFLK